mgnify:CR=1 FL=1
MARYKKEVNDEMEITTKIKEYREKVGMKQSELAELVNVRRETIVCLENGKYNPSTFSQMTHVIAPLSKIVAQM